MYPPQAPPLSLLTYVPKNVRTTLCSQDFIETRPRMTKLLFAILELYLYTIVTSTILNFACSIQPKSGGDFSHFETTGVA